MNPKHYSTEEIESLIHRFERKELPKAEWTHEAHLVVAIWYNSKHDAYQAMDLVRERITNHNESVGTLNTESEGYHESITRFWMWNARTFLAQNDFTSTTEAVNAFIDSDRSLSQYPLTYYSTSILFSVKARMEWIAPDLRTLG